jgi:tRNA pseudouridine55 synthase
MTATDGIVVVDKPGGMTSHDVVARLRKVFQTRKVGHAGTLDPMATGVLVVGVGRATRLLGHLAVTDKTYAATVRLGITTSTDDAEGDVVTTVDATGVSDDAIAVAMAALTGELMQVPSTVSAIKVDGRRAYALARTGVEVELAARPVHVRRFALLARRGAELDVVVDCSTGTYVRALARDLGAALGVGAHLTALRRTRVGGFDVSDALSLADLEREPVVVPLTAAVAAALPRWDVDEETARRLALGQRLAPVGLPAGAVGVFGPGGEVVGLVEERDDAVRPTVVFAPVEGTRDMS